MSFDQTIFYLIYNLPHTSVLIAIAQVLHYLTMGGIIGIIILVANGLSKDPARKLLARLGLLSMAVTYVIEGLLIKNLVHRARPFDTLKDIVVIGPKPTDFSFPSGHASVIFAFAVMYVLILRHKPESYFFLLFALLVSFSRIYIGVHYPSDVLTGIFIGSAISIIIYLSYKNITSK